MLLQHLKEYLTTDVGRFTVWNAHKAYMQGNILKLSASAKQI